MFNLLLILFIIAPTFSIKSMDIESREKKIRKSYSFPSSGKTSIKQYSPRDITQPEHPFILAAESDNDQNNQIIKNYLDNPYFNPNIHRYTTALHACVENKNFTLLPTLLAEPRIDSSIKNTNYKTAHDILKKHKDAECNFGLKEAMHTWQIKLFARYTLDTTTNRICASLKQGCQKGQIKKEIVMDAISIIKQKIIKTENQQKSNEDRILPEAACLPDYATDDFMMKKIWFILNLFDNEFMNEIKL